MPDPLRVLGKIKLKIYIYLDLLNRTEAGSLPQNVQIRQARGKKPPPITSIWLILIVKYYWRLSNPKLEEVALSLNEKHTRKPKKPLSHPSTCSYSDPEGFCTVIKISIVISLRFSSAVASTPCSSPSRLFPNVYTAKENSVSKIFIGLFLSARTSHLR